MNNQMALLPLYAYVKPQHFSNSTIIDCTVQRKMLVKPDVNDRCLDVISGLFDPTINKSDSSHSFSFVKVTLHTKPTRRMV